MASAARQFEPYITPQQHEQIERETGLKHEWHDGEIFAMAGARPDHNTLAANITASLHRQLRGQPCQPWGSDQQVRIAARRSVVYPDVTVACPPHEWDEQFRFALLNPSVLIEVLPPSTGDYDRTEKFDLYRAIDSLQDYVLAASDRRRIEHFHRRQDGSWSVASVTESHQAVDLAGIGCALSLEEVYERLELPSSQEWAASREPADEAS